MQVDQLVAELLARGDMNDETTLELNRILADWRAGTLSPDDDSYLRAFHARIMELPSEPDAPQTHVAADRLDGLSIDEWRDRALQAEAELAQLKDASLNG